MATSVRVYENMLIEQFDFSRVPDTGAAIDVSIQLREIRIVSPLEVPTLDDLDGQIFGGEGTVDGGTQGTTEVSVGA